MLTHVLCIYDHIYTGTGWLAGWLVPPLAVFSSRFKSLYIDYIIISYACESQQARIHDP